MDFYRSRTLNRRNFTLGSAAAFAAITVMPGVKIAAQDGEAEDQLEIFSWWTAGSEAAGLEKLFDAFRAGSPDVEIINAAVAGGAGANAQAALQTRLAGGDPPDSWQSHLAKELEARYVEPGYCEVIDDLWEEEGWGDVIPEGLIAQSTIGESKYIVPVGVHRGNVVFFNKQTMTDNGIEVGETMSIDDFFAAADVLKEAGIPALALGSKDGFEAPHLFENVLAARLGPEVYNGLWDGTTDWAGDEVKAACEDMVKMVGYANEDHPALTWDGAMSMVIEGTAGFTSMGDWAYGNAVVAGVEDNIGYMAHPGSEASFISVVDGFVLPVDAPHPVNARNWLKAVGSAEAQLNFAPDKGCIPARTDVDASSLNEYGQWSAGDFAEASVLASNAHGAAAEPKFQAAIFEACVNMLVMLDAEAFQMELADAASAADLGA
jgi:glucose/mannose transport system substrate-binding protein